MPVISLLCLQGLETAPLPSQDEVIYATADGRSEGEGAPTPQVNTAAKGAHTAGVTGAALCLEDTHTVPEIYL